MSKQMCELCECEEEHNFHHLIPRKNHKNKWFVKRYTQVEMNVGLMVCRACHRTIHWFVPCEKELGRAYNTKEKLQEHPEIEKYLKWKKKRNRND